MLFTMAVLAAVFIGLLEFYRMSLPATRSLERSLALAFGVLFAGHICLQKPHNALLVLCLTVLLLAVVYLFRYRDLEVVIPHLSMTVFGLLYVPFLLAHLSLLRNLEYGQQWVFLALVVAMAGDSAAYFVGSAIGKKKLYPAISPNKSVEGAIGGLAGSVVGAFIFKFMFLSHVDNWVILVMAICLSALGQLGDLFESMLKRSFKVKDSGTIIPGHGGMLDRLDSLLFVFPATYYFVFFIG
jgi:phosphatidate cytidylyltransferase